MSSIIALIRSWINRIIAFFKRKDVVEEPQTSAPEEDSEFHFEPAEPEIWGPGEVVCYYGCPNSKKARKLQLGKKSYR